jgi:histidinol dehydrogenase
MKIYSYPDRKKWVSLSQRPQIAAETLFPAVRDILQTVKREGDTALRRYTREFDAVELEELCCSQEDIAASGLALPDDLKSAIRLAANNIRAFHASQERCETPLYTSPGVRCWREARPISKVGLYIPGGSAPLFSTVLMLGIPAVLAGCEEIIICTPPQKDGSIHPAIRWCASEIGIKHICKVGGAQAIAAMSYGTESIPAVHKIFGPGNQYVTAAKMLVSTEEVAIDMPAGPSEVLIIADHTANPVFIAADLLSQAEHGPDSQVLLLTNDPGLPARVDQEIEKQLKTLPRSETARKALESAGIIILKDMRQCVAFSNDYAPEHLIIQTSNASELASQVSNAGSVFIGPLTPESAGDYASGTNHTLPTNGFARNYSGVSLDDYRKMLTFQTLDARGLTAIGPAIEIMAKAEKLDAHARAVTLRLDSLKEKRK